MDYKIWILLVVLLLLILYVIKEIYFIRFDLLNYINSTKNNTEETNLLLRKNFQNDLNVFANKIKLLNDENLQQFRKITLINTQPIVKNSNYFKEMTCSDSDNETELKYLSDSKMMMSKNSKKSKKSNADELETTSISNFSETSVLDDNHKSLNLNKQENINEETKNEVNIVDNKDNNKDDNNHEDVKNMYNDSFNNENVYKNNEDKNNENKSKEDKSESINDDKLHELIVKETESSDDDSIMIEIESNSETDSEENESDINQPEITFGKHDELAERFQ